MSMKKLIAAILLLISSLASGAPVTSSVGGTNHSNSDAYYLQFNATTILDTPVLNGIIYFDGTKWTSTSFVTMGTSGIRLGNAAYGFQSNLNQDRYLLTDTVNGNKISLSGVGSTFSFDQYAGVFTTAGGGANTGQYRWFTVDGTGAAWTQQMSLSNAGVLNLSNLTASQIVATNVSKDLVSLSAVPENLGGTGTSSSYTASALIFQDAGGGNFNSTANLTYTGAGLNVYNNETISPPGAVTAPTGSTALNISSTTQVSSRITLSGQEFYQAANTSTDGISLLAGVNRANNRQLWIADSLRLAQTTANPTIRLRLSSNGTAAAIDSMATDGITSLPIIFGQGGSATTVTASTLSLSATTTTVPSGDFDVTRSSTGTVVNKISNTNNSNSAANAREQIIVGGNSGGDAKTTYTVNGVQDWVIGLDNSVSDQFVIGASDTPGVADKLQIATNGDTTIVNGNLIMGTNGKTLQFPLSDNDKILFYNTTTASKIDTSGTWNTNFRSGSTGSANTGIFNWLVSGAAGWVNAMQLANNGNLTLSTGSLLVATAGKTVSIKTGSNACAGTGAVMVAGVVTVNTTCAATGDVIFIMKTAAGGVSTTGMPVVTIVNGTSFTITGGASDTSTWSWIDFKAP